jgi:prepilin-type N-terminal cleavage/methylation domain-containing protein
MGKVAGPRASNATVSAVQLKRSAGFTLIELIVVMAILTIVIAIAVPPLQNSLVVDHVKKAGRWIILKVPALKERAVREQKIYRLHIDLDADRFWISDDSMDEDQLLDAARQGFELTGGLEVLDVEYPRAETIAAGLAEIRFYPKGYSDRAIIHLRDDDARLSFQVEPFLSNVVMVEEYVTY